MTAFAETFVVIIAQRLKKDYLLIRSFPGFVIDPFKGMDVPEAYHQDHGSLNKPCMQCKMNSSFFSCKITMRCSFHVPFIYLFILSSHMMKEKKSKGQHTHFHILPKAFFFIKFKKI